MDLLAPRTRSCGTFWRGCGGTRPGRGRHQGLLEPWLRGLKQSVARKGPRSPHEAMTPASMQLLLPRPCMPQVCLPRARHCRHPQILTQPAARIRLRQWELCQRQKVTTCKGSPEMLTLPLLPPRPQPNKVQHHRRIAQPRQTRRRPPAALRPALPLRIQGLLMTNALSPHLLLGPIPAIGRTGACLQLQYRGSPDRQRPTLPGRLHRQCRHLSSIGRQSQGQAHQLRRRRHSPGRRQRPPVSHPQWAV